MKLRDSLDRTGSGDEEAMTDRIPPCPGQALIEIRTHHGDPGVAPGNGKRPPTDRVWILCSIMTRSKGLSNTSSIDDSNGNAVRDGQRGAAPLPA
jgi:hypothetical protein